MGKILTINDLKSYNGLNVGYTNLSLCPTKSQIEGFVITGYGASFNSGVANNQLVDYVNVYATARYVNGIYVINRCIDKFGRGVTLYYRNYSTNEYGITLSYNSSTGIIPGSNSVNVAPGGSALFEVGWLGDFEIEGDFNVRVWASTSTNQLYPTSSMLVDNYTVFLGEGEGTEVVPKFGNMWSAPSGSAYAINDYIENYLNGDGSNYYFYIEIGEFA